MLNCTRTSTKIARNLRACANEAIQFAREVCSLDALHFRLFEYRFLLLTLSFKVARRFCSFALRSLYACSHAIFRLSILSSFHAVFVRCHSRLAFTPFNVLSLFLAAIFRSSFLPLLLLLFVLFQRVLPCM